MKKKTAIDYFGSKAEIARVLKISRQAVSNWGDVVPIKKAWKLQAASGGVLDMRLKDYH